MLPRGSSSSWIWWPGPIGGQNPAKLDQTNEKVCIGLGGLGDSNF
jgi:hypothetical protein